MTAKGTRGGFTLVEVMLTGTIAVFMTLALMEGLIVSAKISHENAELLAAEAFAWDTAWRWLNKKNEDFENEERITSFENAYRNEGVEMASNECPVIYRADAPAKCFVHIDTVANVGTTNALDVVSEYRIIEVDVEWGPSDARVCLMGGGQPLSNGPKSYNIPIAVIKGNVDRGR